MAGSSSTDDFFGVGMIGADPYAQQKSDKLARLQAIDGLVSSSVGSTPKPDAQTYTATKQAGFDSQQAPAIPAPTPGASNPWISAAASWAQQQGVGGNYGWSPNGGEQQSGQSSPDVMDPDAGGSTTPGRATPGAGSEGRYRADETPVLNNPNRATQASDAYWTNLMGGTSNPDGSRTGAGVTGANAGAGTWANVTPDQIALRTALSKFLTQNMGQMPGAYGGQMDVSTPGYMSAASAALGNLPASANQWLYPGSNVLSSIFAGKGAGAGAMDTAAGGLAELARTGGTPDITKALGDIRTQGMTDLDLQLATIREQYGKLGLGAGSDVSRALASGSASGIAGINAQQSQLIAQILSQGAQTKLGAGQALGNLGGLQGSMQMSALGQLPAFAGASTQAGMAQATGAAQLGQTDIARQQNNISMAYNDWLRQQTPTYLSSAISYTTGTGYTPVQNKPVVQSSGTDWGAVVASVLPYIMMAI